MGTPGLFVGYDAPISSPRLNDGDRPTKDDDEISLTSTVMSEHDPEERYEVEDVLCEIEDDGEARFLIQWKNYPLTRATFEPEENMSEELLATWRETQKKQALGEKEIFDHLAWLNEMEDMEVASRRRHQLRNLRRKRLGLRLTLRQGESKEDYYDSDEDVSQDDFNSILPPPKLVRKQSDLGTFGDELPKKQPPPLPPKQPTEVRPAAPRKRASAERSKSPSWSKSPATAIPSATATPLQLRPQKPPPVSTTITGYQGTAKRPTVVVEPVGSTITVAPLPNAVLKAKKTKPSGTKIVKSTQPSNNVFVGGKTRRTRPKLGDSMTDATKSSRMFTTHRVRRIAEIQSRDKADQAPANPPAGGMLFSISSGPPAAPSSKDPATTPPALSAVEPPSKSTLSSGMRQLPRPVLKRSADDMNGTPASNFSIATSDVPANVEQSRAAQPLAKKRKSVQWADLSLTEKSDAMDVDESVPTGTELKPSPRRLRSPPADLTDSLPNQPIRKMSVVQYHKRAVPRNIDKTIELGPAGTATVKVIFENVKSEAGEWYSLFVRQESMQFGSNCNARTFDRQRNNIVDRVLSHGNVKAMTPADEGLLTNAAERLKLGSFGVFSFRDGFTTVIYPKACQDWKAALAIGEDAPTGPSGPLKYVVFKPAITAAQPLPPRKTEPPPSELSASLFDDLFPMEYSKLQPSGLRDVRHNFFLAFPPSRVALLDTVAEWLRMKNSNCRVYSTKTTGDWAAFTNPKIVSNGVIVVHESVTSTLRRYPSMLKLLMHKTSATYLFWCIGESLQQFPLYPSIRSMHDPAKPGRLEITRLFPHGSAVLVTPSFLVAEPCKAHALFSWHRGVAHKPRNNIKLVVASGLGNFLRDLAMEKDQHRKYLLAQADEAQGSQAKREERARELGLSHDECKARFGVWSIFEGLEESKLASIVPDEQLETIIFADESIDPLDEQSLDLATNPAIPPSAKLFGYPVAYHKDYHDTADKCEDRYREYWTFQKWFQFVWPFFLVEATQNDKSRKDFNTFMGFFHTPQAYNSSKQKWMGRHPWLAVYRVANLHEKPWKATELLIWDPAAQERFPTHDEVAVSDLNYAQQELIEFLREMGKEKNPDLPLERVWLGGFQELSPVLLNSEGAELLPLDRTLEAAQHMVQNTVEYLPSLDPQLAERGYRQVSMVLPEDDQTPSDVFGDEDDPNARMIFHPPRSLRSFMQSRCQNLLFNWVKEVKGDTSKSSFPYKFTPTVQWYTSQQVAENRNFEHILVAAWKEVFGLLRVPKELLEPVPSKK
ncbi:hypothetical protein C8035_v002648 [Colletotrichum spinosum]|uniref:Chromo domain-containing protein n=1 Tax=Colletotrichum spinosum TaxID=1347390 RepID=A0A4R8QKT0_9PEZI|nr:hypothetical protein C8035_v002648 [Colletotrichum spinosum]